jgi:hypothetical protein
MISSLNRVFIWLQLQFRVISFDSWTRDTHRGILRYQFKAVPTDHSCREYEVTIVRSMMGGDSQVSRYRWPRAQVLMCQSDSAASHYKSRAPD